jgi:hypothetical protein
MNMGKQVQRQRQTESPNQGKSGRTKLGAAAHSKRVQPSAVYSRARRVGISKAMFASRLSCGNWSSRIATGPWEVDLGDAPEGLSTSIQTQVSSISN